ncbi:MAG: HU family DNA-binding protein [Cyclobacteriaceae bacterium]
MTKSDIINEISKQTGVDKIDVSFTIEAFIKTVKNAMAEGEAVTLRGFGTFNSKKRAKKVARNISTNKAIVIDEHYIPSFKPSREFVDLIKKNVKIK